MQCDVLSENVMSEWECSDVLHGYHVNGEGICRHTPVQVVAKSRNWNVVARNRANEISDMCTVKVREFRMYSKTVTEM